MVVASPARGAPLCVAVDLAREVVVAEVPVGGRFIPPRLGIGGAVEEWGLDLELPWGWRGLFRPPLNLELHMCLLPFSHGWLM